MYKNNVIDLKSRANKATQQAKGSKKTSKNQAQAPVLDMTERREAILQDERRKVRRTILTGFVGAYIVNPSSKGAHGGLLKVEIYDISENGIAFDVPDEHGHYTLGEELVMRVYLSQDTYFSFLITVQNQRLLNGEPAYRHGGHFVKGTLNDEALHHFVKFIETVSASLQKDTGDVMVSGLKK